MKQYMVDCYGTILFANAKDIYEARRKFKKYTNNNNIAGYDDNNVRRFEQPFVKLKEYEVGVFCVKK